MTRTKLVVGVLAAVLGPVIVLWGQAQRSQPHGDLKLDCGECHVPERWTPVDKPPSFRHASTGFALEGAHARASCRSCHRTLVFARVGTACTDCHGDVHRGELGPRCDACHAPTSSWNNQREIFRVHYGTRFPLMAVHARLDCAACHKRQQPYEYKNTPAECGNCHYQDYLGAANPNHVLSGFSRRCQDCHLATANSWHEATFSHESFPLTGGHGGLTCARCHGSGRPHAISAECVSCHQQDFASAGDPPHAGFPNTCLSCHTTQAWRPAKFDHSNTGFPLSGAHLNVECSKCHAGGRFKGTPQDCYSCHKPDYDGTSSPNHKAAGFPTACQNCHSTVSWQGGLFTHDKFPLTGAHASVACSKCHVGGRYAGTPSDCWSCHQTDYNSATNPNHVASSFPRDCQVCHSTSAWHPATVDHSKTRFPLSGAHKSVACARCHVNGQYTGTPTDCWSCHQANYNSTTNPNHVASNFPHQCETCHTTSAWQPASFDHNKTRFPLTGAHKSVACAQCHVNGQYTGTPTDCWSCHQAQYNGTTNPSHAAAGFPRTCQDCHTTSSWQGATFDHDGRYFPIYSGSHRGRWSTCSACHVSPSNYRVFECILCHPHSDRQETDSHHSGVSGYVYASAACYQCHPRGSSNAPATSHRPGRVPRRRDR